MTPLFALRSSSDLGVGNLTALTELIEWCEEYGQKFILLLPVNACGADFSPYNAISSVALEPIYLDLADTELFRQLRLPRLPEIPVYTKNNDGLIDYRAISDAIHDSLASALEGFDPPLDFIRFKEKHKSWLDAYALFRALSEKFQTCDHQSWPASHRKYALAALVDDPSTEKRALFHKYVQWICDAAWKKVKSYADRHKIWLLGDLPFSISLQSADYWHHPERFVSGWFAGAPPEPAFQGDEFIRKWGQNWGLPLYNWEGEAPKQHPWWQERISAMTRYFHGFRVDHALGFFRVFAFPWSPDENGRYASLNPEEVEQMGLPLPKFLPGADDSPEHKLINLEHGRSLFGFLQSLAPKSVIVAEDLGLVPDYVRPALLELKIPGMKIPHFERLPPDLRYSPVEDYPELSFATWATHDHPPLAALWRGWQERRLSDSAAEWEVRCFLNFLGEGNDRRELSLPADLHQKALEKLAQAPSRLLCLQLTDVFRLELRFNVPGSISSTNWSSRFPFTVKDMSSIPEQAALSRLLSEVCQQARRIPCE